MRYDDLELFLKFARYKNLGKTARQLHISGSSVRRRLKALENELRCTTYKKNRKGFELTDAGQILLTTAKEVLLQIDTLRNRYSEVKIDNRPAKTQKPTERQAPPREKYRDAAKSMAEFMADGDQELHRLLNERCQDERAYQHLLEKHPWMLGSQYQSVQRHFGLDNQNIPDFTATRSSDQCHDILELKQPFVKCFRSNGDFSSDFNVAWNQAERYIGFTRRQRDYLREEKKLRFENPRCLLIAGYEIEENLLRRIREKESIH